MRRLDCTRKLIIAQTHVYVDLVYNLILQYQSKGAEASRDFVHDKLWCVELYAKGI
jgi:hypothetical protein